MYSVVEAAGLVAAHAAQHRRAVELCNKQHHQPHMTL